MEEPPPESTSADELVIEGTGAAPGVVLGTAYRYEAAAPTARRDAIAPDAVDAELERLANAVQRAEQGLEADRVWAPDALVPDADAIFEAQALMLGDEDVLEAIRQRIRDANEPAGAAVQAVLSAHRERLEDSEDAHLRTGADDLLAFERRLLRALRRGAAAAHIDGHSVVVAQDLTASDLLRLRRHNLLGGVTARGGPTSHTAIVAQALGVPLLVGAGGALGAVSAGDRVVVDGDEGRLIARPDPATEEEYRTRAADAPSPTAKRDRAPEGPLRTTDGHAVTLRANVGLEAELDPLRPAPPDGIGLLRTELFLRADGDPRSVDEERQVEAYRQVIEAAGEGGATIRLLDVGGDDRRSQGAAGAHEGHPVLGRRGLRVLLDRPDELLRPQLRALLRANREGPLRILLPMVTDGAEVRRVRRILDEESTRLTENGVPHDANVPLGAMVEVPAMALQAPAFTELVDFFSIGTNDLTQYVLAVDRADEQVAARHDALHPAVLGLILRVVEAGRMSGCPVEVCGEIAGDVQAVPVLLGLGVDTLSVAPPSLPAVRRIVRATGYDAAKDLARDVLQADDAQAVRRRARAWVDTHLSSSGTASSTTNTPDR
ncbi:phosphotransferase system enzyme I (PtsI) [Salinibacter ruber]|uniref:Phosphoenolpyruvate-protein phosphotransferase n=1 Tax=Salinibacter ruber TaxID=146919 RepID=A0A9X2PTH6_9BACT|nr:phosphoenolpyruvate--protein phosphotransferase [Salinibacter ruber]MCS3676520.1 phosphotransferase system enzyme I (PtsI) [Salinibacter ruber]MCS3679808.1 phosphotransferase system enzyme I (PtsI) [Salinibacter ruber]